MVRRRAWELEKEMEEAGVGPECNGDHSEDEDSQVDIEVEVSLCFLTKYNFHTKSSF